MSNTTTLTPEQLHYHATMMMCLGYDKDTNEYYNTYGIYAAPELRGKRKVYSVEDIIKNYDNMLRSFAIYGCD